MTDNQIYEICKSRGYFEVLGNASIATDKSFSLMMPPPNVTGVLHIGHALTFTLQDIITRYKRMDGYITLYQPGLDHAGIATQNIVEKQLLEQGISKESLGREEFIKRVWEWKEQSGGSIIKQMEALGITPAWSRMRFTMDEGLQNAVREAFCTWYDKGLIYQGNYMVNWCIKDGALSDIEVQYIKQDTHLYYLRYPIVDSTHAIIVATTRPETLFGDVAIMINPLDTRYAPYIGQSVRVPLINREIPIIADEAVDMGFGTGAVKVTPAHDEHDYQVALRHDLQALVIFDEKGVLNTLAGKFCGMDRLEARSDIVSALEAQDAIEKSEPYSNQVGICYRCGTMIEPYISKQWFIDTAIAQNTIHKVNQPHAHKDSSTRTKSHLHINTSAHTISSAQSTSNKLTTSNTTRFFPPSWLNNFNAWMKELRPWCISRQLWWGHRIPVWYCQNPACKHVFASKFTNETSCPKCSSALKQDDDVLDTWFSSALWAFSTLGWGNGGACKECYHDKDATLASAASDMALFYPNSLLITGFDILFFWVARMMFSGESLLGELPFYDIYLHALVRDEHGQKMSKSRGNVIDPLSMIEQFGADALRFTLAHACAQGRDVRLSLAQLEISKNFTHKLYNATQFLLLYASQLAQANTAHIASETSSTHTNTQAPSSEHVFSGFLEQSTLAQYHTPLGRYAKSRLNLITQELRAALESYRFNDGANVLYRFLWGEFCDWCIEMAKAQKEAIYELGSVLLDALKLLHPYMPFITESLYHTLKATSLASSDSIMIARFPHESTSDEALLKEFDIIKDAVISLRRVKALVDMANKLIPTAYLATNITLPPYAITIITKLARIESLHIIPYHSALQQSIIDVGEHVKSYLCVEDIDIRPILARLNTQKQKLEKEIHKLDALAHNANFMQHAPAHVLESNATALTRAQTKHEEILAQIHALEQAIST